MNGQPEQVLPTRPRIRRKIRKRSVRSLGGGCVPERVADDGTEDFQFAGDDGVCADCG
jgi:hypothetical protein